MQGRLLGVRDLPADHLIAEQLLRMLGVPAATVLMVYVQNGLFLWRSARLLNRSVWTVMPWGGLALRFLPAAVLGAGLAAVYRVRPLGSFFELALAGAAYLLVYFGLCLAFRFASVTDIKSMLGRTNA